MVSSNAQKVSHPSILCVRWSNFVCFVASFSGTVNRFTFSMLSFCGFFSLFSSISLSLSVSLPSRCDYVDGILDILFCLLCKFVKATNINNQHLNIAEAQKSHLNTTIHNCWWSIDCATTNTNDIYQSLSVTCY